MKPKTKKEKMTRKDMEDVYKHFGKSFLKEKNTEPHVPVNDKPEPPSLLPFVTIEDF